MRSWTALLLLLIVLACIYVRWIGVSVRHGTMDFKVYYIAANAIARGESPYGFDPRRWDEITRGRGQPIYLAYHYPPLTALTVRTFSHLRPVQAARVWLWGSTLAFALSALLLARTSAQPESAFLAFAVVGGFFPVLDTLSLGQVNAFLLLALCAAYYALQRRAPYWAGGWLALGIHLKILPIVHLGAMLAGRRWKAVGGALLAGAMLTAAGIALLGWDEGLGFVGAGALASTAPLEPFPANQGLSGLFARSLEAHPDLARWLWSASVLATLLATAAFCWRREETDWLTESRRFALVTVSASVVLPFSWYHQLCLLVIPLFLLVGEAVEQRGRRWRLLPLAAGYAVTCLHGLHWGSWQEAGIPLSLPFWFCLFLWVLLAKDLRESRAS